MNSLPVVRVVDDDSFEVERREESEILRVLVTRGQVHKFVLASGARWCLCQSHFGVMASPSCLYGGKTSFGEKFFTLVFNFKLTSLNASRLLFTELSIRMLSDSFSL